MRKQRIALIDPINGVAYYRPARKGSGSNYREDSALQELLDSKGLEAAKQYSRRFYQGVVIAVLVD